MAKTVKDPMEKKREDHASVCKELEAAQKRMREEGWVPTEAEGEALDEKAETAIALQKEIDAHDERIGKLNSAVEGGRKVKDPIFPGDHQPDVEDDDEKIGGGGRRRRFSFGDPVATDGKRAVGYMRMGAYVVAQEGLKNFNSAGRPRSGFKLADVPTLIPKSERDEPLVPVSREQIKEMIEGKAVPTLGDDVIEPSRVPDIVRVTEHEQLRLRDVLNVSQTSSDAVKYTRIVSYTRAAATVANSATKPEATMELDSVTEAVRTIAVHIPVEEQQLSDYPALAGLINTELLYDVEKHLEELIMYGDGTGENFEGILQDAAVQDAREESGDTLIDISRRGITDVRRAGYEPNGILIDPLDWEDVVLEKGSDNRYVWVVVTEGATQRLWAVPVIETVAMENFEGVTTEERNLVVGDFARGATLWDREQSSIQVGWINDQFVKNQRTILAEMRAAFGVRRPGAFRKHQTQAASSS